MNITEPSISPETLYFCIEFPLGDKKCREILSITTGITAKFCYLF